MKNTRFLYIVFIMFSLLNSSYGETIKYQSFESGSDDWSYTPSPATYEVGGDVWAIVTSSFHTFGTIPSESTHFWGMQDLANSNGGVAGGLWSTLTFASVDISGHSSVVVSFDYEVDGWDNGDDIKYQAYFDGSGQGEVLLVDGASNLDQNGTVSINVTSGTNAVYLVLTIKQNGGSDYGGLDNFKVTGTAAGAVNDPSSFSASVQSSSQINLTWTDNGDSDNVLLAFNIANTFGTPTDGSTYAADATITGGGTVLQYSGTDSYSHTSLSGNTAYYYKVWSYDGSSYSSGVIDDGTTYKDVPTNHPTTLSATTS